MERDRQRTDRARPVIPRAAITAWGTSVGWATDEQVEQDLLLSRLIIELATDPYLGEELVFRGGTCLHKLYADKPYRYSEDLDFVRRTGGGIRDLTQPRPPSANGLAWRCRPRWAATPRSTCVPPSSPVAERCGSRWR